MGYFGSKTASGAFQAVIAHMPPHDIYIETHLGSGAVMKAKPRARWSIGIDRDPAVFDLWMKEGDHRPETLFCGADAVEELELFFSDPCRPRTLIYADPPYVLATRSSKKRYRFDYNDDDHRRLIACLRQVPAAVILSGYPSALYDELLGDWRTVEFQVMTRGGPRTEKLWLNFPAGEVQWSRFAGTDFTDRQRIKRKAARWARAYRALPAGERLAVLAALLGEHGDRS